MEPTSRSIHHEELLENLGWVQGLARRLVAPSRAEDVGQDVWLKALERPPRAREGPELRAWLARVTRTQARQDARSRERRERREQRSARVEEVPSTVDVVARGEAQRLVSEAVMELEEPARSAVLLRYLDGLTAVQIAQRVGENPAAVRKRLSRALETLRARLEERLGGRKELLGALLPLAGRGNAPAGASLAIQPLAIGLLVAAVASVALWFAWRAQGAVVREQPSPAIASLEGEPRDVVVAALDGKQGEVPAVEARGSAPVAEASVVRPSVANAGSAASSASGQGSLLAAVPANAFALVHLLDPSGLRSRAERNDWIALAGSPEGEPALVSLAREFERETGTDFDGLLEVVLQLSGESVLFFSGEVAGFLTEPPADRAALAGLLDGWLVDETRRSLEVDGARVQLAPWPETTGAVPDRTGHFLAFLDHPLALGLYSGDSEEALLDTLADSLAGLRTDERRAQVVERFLAAGGATTGGVEAFVDFTPFVPQAEQALRDAVRDVLPDPTGLLGLERGTWLFLSADVFPGTKVELQARLRIPEDTLAARLADTFEPLPRTLPPDLPRGTWTTWALDWNLSRFYATARAALEEVEAGDLSVVDQGLAAAETLSGVDPVADVIDQLAGWFAWYHVLAPEDPPRRAEEGIGFLAGLVDGERFLEAFEDLIGAGGIGVEAVELEGAETYLAGPGFLGDEGEGGMDGGLSLLPDRLLFSLGRGTLVRGLRALARVPDAGLRDGSRLQAAFDENPGAFAFGYMELARLRALELWEEGLPELLAEDVFEAELVVAGHRTAEGFELRVYTR